MKQQDTYIEYRKSGLEAEEKIADCMRHLQARFELGSSIIICKNPELVKKLVEKHWQKLTRQLQQKRQTESSADEILSSTRTISRMQRMTITNEDPAENPDASCYIINAATSHSLPTHCYTVYMIDMQLSESTVQLLPESALLVLYTEDQLGTYKKLPDKTILESRVLLEHGKLKQWLEKQHINLTDIIYDIEKSNLALDTLLGSNSLQSEFLLHAGQCLRLFDLAQPCDIEADIKKQLHKIKQLEKNIRALSPAFLSDQASDGVSDESFLLKDIAGMKHASFELITSYITKQRDLGRINLANALERQLGFVRL